MLTGHFWSCPESKFTISLRVNISLRGSIEGKICAFSSFRWLAENHSRVVRLSFAKSLLSVRGLEISRTPCGNIRCCCCVHPSIAPLQWMFPVCPKVGTRLHFRQMCLWSIAVSDLSGYVYFVSMDQKCGYLGDYDLRLGWDLHSPWFHFGVACFQVSYRPGRLLCCSPGIKPENSRTLHGLIAASYKVNTMDRQAVA